MNTKDQQYTTPQATITIDGSKIKQIRESKGLTQDYLATVVGVAIRTVSCWENNRSPNIKRENAESVAKALEVPLEDIRKSELAFLEGTSQPEENARKPEEEQPVFQQKRQKKYQLSAFLGLIFIIALTSLYIVIRNTEPSTHHSSEPLVTQTKGRITAERYLPDHTPSGQSFPVVIKVSSSFTNTTSFLLKETLPPVCTVIRGAPTADLQNNSPSNVKWVSKLDNGKESRFAYLARCDASLEQVQKSKFSGQVLVDNDPQERTVSGDNIITITDYHWADNNQDHRIDDNEILAIYNSFDILKELGADIEEIRQAWINSKGNHWNSEQKKFMVLGKPCGQSWKTPLIELNGIIQGVHSSGTSVEEQGELLLDVSTPKGSVTVHVFPKRCIDNTPGKFTLIQQEKMFDTGDAIRVIGSEFQLQQEKKICAAEIIADNYTFTRKTKNELRDLVTGALNGEMCQSGAKESKQQLISARYSQPRGKEISWHLSIPSAAPAVVILIQNIPPGTTLLTSSPPYHSYDQEAGTVKWLLTDLEPGKLPMNMELDIPIKKKGEISGELLFENRSEDPIFWLF
ncbi:MAG: helix-turn-helix domain-containing protein [Candidatus Electrothrix communis]|nr:MAG: helix-turn-helix domain-containing protein [Candidatus Electrothrix communis]